MQSQTVGAYSLCRVPRLADGSSVLYALRESVQAYVSVAYIEPLIFADLLRPPEVGGAAFPTSLFGFSGIGARRRWNQSMFVFS